jgi:cysteine-rich repeat protein
MYQEPQDTECPDGAESYETNKDCLMHCVMPQSSSVQSLPPDQECKPSFQCSIVANNGSCAEGAFNCFCGGVITDTQGCSMTINDGGENVTCTGSCRKCAPCSSSASSVPPGCGNGRREASEECDDGNTVSGDGCSASCTLEDGGYCRQLP